jgi:hypothetical protein
MARVLFNGLDVGDLQEVVCVCIELCCAVLCCAVLCCAVLGCAVLCCAVLCCAVLCCAVLCCAVLYCTMLFCTNNKWIAQWLRNRSGITSLQPSSLHSLWQSVAPYFELEKSLGIHRDFRSIYAGSWFICVEICCTYMMYVHDVWTSCMYIMYVHDVRALWRVM